MEFENFHEITEGKAETDEYYEGGLKKNMHERRKLALKDKEYFNKKLLQGFVKRGGDAVIRTIPDATENSLLSGIYKYVKRDTTLYSDDNKRYEKLAPIYTRSIVVHSKGNYVDKNNPEIHTNTIENLWSNFSRMIRTYIHVSQKHLQNYANETVFRYNTKKMKPANACVWFLQNIQGTKITWKDIKNGNYNANRNKERAA